MPDDDDFYEDDEPIEGIIAAIKRGTAGVTNGPRILDQRSMSLLETVVISYETP